MTTDGDGKDEIDTSQEVDRMIGGTSVIHNISQ